MATLTEDIRLFIVERLACFDTPTEVVDAVKEAYGIDIDRNQASIYNPTTSKGKNLGKKWKAIFHAKRKAFLEEMENIPLAHMSVRLRELEKSYEKLKRAKNYLAANQVLEQIAKEIGGIFCSKVKLTRGDKGGAPTQREVSVTGGRLTALREKNAE